MARRRRRMPTIHHKFAPKGQTLKVLARIIEERFPELRTSLRVTERDTGSPLAGTCFKIPGKGARGTELTVHERESGKLVLRFSSASYRARTSTVAEWIEERAGALVDEAWIDREWRCAEGCTCGASAVAV